MSRAGKTRLTDAAIVEAVVAHFVRTASDVSVDEIAALVGCSASTIRKRLAHGLPGLQACRESRASQSSNYTWEAVGSHRVWVYGPTRAALAARLRVLGGAS